VVIGEAGNLVDARRQLAALGPDVVLLDIAIGGETSWDLLRLLRSRESMQEGGARVGVLILSAFREDQYAIQALRSGADGFLNKESAPELLVAAIRRVASGRRYISVELADRLAGALSSTGSSAPADGTQLHETLSEREFRVLVQIAQGRSLTAIADDLHISPKTVTTYRSRVLQKLGLENNAAITRYALDRGLIH
jgi:DNA-binding NarL/FixJ family response regulator